MTERPSVWFPEDAIRWVRVWTGHWEVWQRAWIPLPSGRGKENRCMECDGAQTWHDIPLASDRCEGWLGVCLVCGGYSPTALYQYRTKTRVCRPCRRYIKHKEKELWLRKLAWEKQQRDLSEWERGAKSLKVVRRLLSREHSPWRAEASELALTSQTS